MPHWRRTRDVGQERIRPGAGEPPTWKFGGETVATAGGPAAEADTARLAPGAVLAGRYRIVARIGGGGMGVVYRADDLRLGIHVALKLVAGDGAVDAGRRERLAEEVRLAREVTHPSVCRVYDLGEAEGVTFLTMEHVDGEDLASLLRRIGRLPPEKALDIAGQLCAGLAAAHAQGVLHRDLKPANVMLDGRGRVRIVDFGLAVRPEGGRAEVAGTPEYMAPEQLTRGEASARADVWALGCVLYELFTGRKAFAASSLADLRRRHEAGPPPTPASLVPGLEPAVEAAILRCLEPDPLARTASVARVAAELPGGDPLSALVAAGETPPPDLVAATGGAGTLAPPLAAALLAGTVLLVAAGVVVGYRSSALAATPVVKAPAALADRAAELLAVLDANAVPADHAEGFTLDRTGRRFLRGVRRWPESVSALRYWYRLAPHPLSPQPPVIFLSRSQPDQEVAASPGLRVLPDDPAPRSGEALVELSPAGRLLRLRIHRDAPAGIAGPGLVADFRPLLAAAGLAAHPTVAGPARMDDVPADRTYSWLAPSPLPGGEPLRVTGASLAGRPVAFAVEEPWRRTQSPVTAGPNAWLYPLVFFAALGGAAWLARRNVRQDRADREAASRGAKAYFVLVLTHSLLVAHHVPTAYEAELLVQILARALLLAASFWLLYLGLEPAVRRQWPRVLTATSRLLRGRGRDALVGRELLIGTFAGTGFAVLSSLAFLAAGRATSYAAETLVGLREAVLPPFECALFELTAVPVTLFLLAVLARRLRHSLAAAAVLVLLLAVAGGWGSPLYIAVELAFYASFFVVVLRAGALAAATYGWTSMLLATAPLSPDLGGAAAPATLAATGAVLAVAGWGWWHSRARNAPRVSGR